MGTMMRLITDAHSFSSSQRRQNPAGFFMPNSFWAVLGVLSRMRRGGEYRANAQEHFCYI